MENTSFRLPEKQIPTWLKSLGCFSMDKQSWRFNWGNFSKPRSLIHEISWTWGLALSLYKCGDDNHFGIHIHLGYPGFYISLPIRSKKSAEMYDSWGFSLVGEGGYNYYALHLNWGRKTKILQFPFGTKHYSFEYLFKDMTWFEEKETPTLGKKWIDNYNFINENKHYETYPYNYLLSSGEVQKVYAKVSIGRSTRVRNTLRWFGWPKKIYYSIDVNFVDKDGKVAEVGERTGSWKGGCTGCGYDLKQDETAYQCLKRMEKERRF